MNRKSRTQVPRPADLALDFVYSTPLGFNGQLIPHNTYSVEVCDL